MSEFFLSFFRFIRSLLGCNKGEGQITHMLRKSMAIVGLIHESNACVEVTFWIHHQNRFTFLMKTIAHNTIRTKQLCDSQTTSLLYCYQQMQYERGPLTCLKESTQKERAASGKKSRFTPTKFPFFFPSNG